MRGHLSGAEDLLSTDLVIGSAGEDLATLKGSFPVHLDASAPGPRGDGPVDARIELFPGSVERLEHVTVAELGNFRWLTVGPPGQDDIAIVLMAIPGPPMMEAETTAQVHELMSKGFAGTVFLTTEDCQATYEELRGRGVEFTEAPEQRPYGIDCGFRDPSGNSVRLTQVMEMSAS